MCVCVCVRVCVCESESQRARRGSRVCVGEERDNGEGGSKNDFVMLCL